jgi:hypothetical protein
MRRILCAFVFFGLQSRRESAPQSFVAEYENENENQKKNENQHVTI